MVRFSTVLLVIYSLLVVFLVDPVFAQTDSPPAGNAVGTMARQSESSTAIKRSIAESDKAQRERSSIDAKEMEKISRQTPQYHRRMSTWKMVGIGLAIVATAAIVYLLIRYGEECKRREPTNCRPGVDQVCICVEFENH